MPFDVFGTPGENVKREGIHTDDLAAPFSSVQRHACARVYTASHRRPRPLSDGRWCRGFRRMLLNLVAAWNPGGVIDAKLPTQPKRYRGRPRTTWD